MKNWEKGALEAVKRRWLKVLKEIRAAAVVAEIYQRSKERGKHGKTVRSRKAR